MDPAIIPQLRTENEALRRQNAEQQQLIAQLQQTIRELQQRLEASERAGKRQAAPFSRGAPKANPKKPGRKSGSAHGKHGHRPPPPHVDETHDAPLPQCCTECGDVIIESHVDAQYQTEIPRTPIIRRFDIHCGNCRGCGKAYRGTHPFQTSMATGAAQSQLGPDAQAAMVDLNKRAGLSYGKIAGTFQKLFGIAVTPGACAQVVLRASRRLEPVYTQILDHLRTANDLTPDETGWRIGGVPHWMHAWVSGDGTTGYAIDRRRGAAVLAEVIGWDWAGRMTHDGYASYDGFTDAVHQQCVDHALRRARALLERQTDAAKYFPQRVIELFQEALQVRNAFLAGTLNAAALAQAHAEYVAALLDLTEPVRLNEANERMAAHLYAHGEQWLQFLEDPSIPATNHRAEQALKTSIVNRKVWGGNRTDAGGHAQEVTSSVLETCKKKAIDAFGFISDAFRGVLGNLFPAAAAKPP
jgi:transposase